MTEKKQVKKKKKPYKRPTSIDEARDNFRYRGKIVIEAGGRIFSTRSGERAQELLKKVKKKYPEDVPTLTYLPKKDEVVIPTLVKMK